MKGEAVHNMALQAIGDETLLRMFLVYYYVDSRLSKVPQALDTVPQQCIIQMEKCVTTRMKTYKAVRTSYGGRVAMDGTVFFHYRIKSPTLFTCFCLNRVTNTGRWNSISGAASPYLYLLIDQGANVIPAIASDTGCALCLCSGTTGAWGIMNNTVS